MCGIWGLVGKSSEEKKIIKELIADLFVLSESRGKEASGICGKCDGQIKTYKIGQPASRLIKREKYQKLIDKLVSEDEMGIIGHARLATNGSEKDSKNNQPVVCDGVAVVHNGIIVNSGDIWEKSGDGLTRESELDTEIFVKLFAKYINIEENNDIDAMINTFTKIQGTASIVSLQQDNHRMLAATNNGSLYFWRSKDKKLALFVSERSIFEKLYKKNRFIRTNFSIGAIKHIVSNRGICVDALSGEISGFKLQDYQVCKDSSNPGLAHEILQNKYSDLEIDVEPIKKIKRCTRCILPETMPFIEFDDEGVCNYCRTYKKMEYKGVSALDDWNKTVQNKYKNKENDSIISFSGGRDSSYGLHYFVKEMGLKPVAYNYDWGMVTDLARRNQARMCAALGVELITVSADIRKKRENIRKNISAWLRNPELGLVPLFMAGDKAFYYYANVIKKRFNVDSILLASNPFEKTYFKSGFCGVKPPILNNIENNIDIEKLDIKSLFKMGGFYAGNYVKNSGYINSSIVDTALATMSYYVIPHDYFRLFDYIPWDEKTVDDVLINEYDWEIAPDTESTWRIGDGTAPFYNYIYYYYCGFTENDTLRSNQIREGVLSRDEGLKLAFRDNATRWESLEWYFDVIDMNMLDVLKVIRKKQPLYQK